MRRPKASIAKYIHYPLFTKMLFQDALSAAEKTICAALGKQI
jgi:hypothetical protein|tara:strand:- start:385 stop:510 length:126 start_codon:yes stop_codon:yes gene_type:complete